MIRKPIMALLACLAFCLSSRAQDVAVKTNLLYDATLTANAGVEVGIAPKWTLDVSGNLNAWKLNDGKRWKHWMVQPEARYWFCDRFAGHFVGVHALAGQGNVGNFDIDKDFFGINLGILDDKRVQGWAVGAGLAYGYAWILGEHWNLEAEIGVGYVYGEYDTYDCDNCGRKLESDIDHHYVGPTKAAINIVYLF